MTVTLASPPAPVAGGLPLRPYQQTAVDAVQDAWTRDARRSVLVAPTGAGKTVMFAHLAATEVAAGGRVLVLTHRVDLVDQTADRLRQVSPGARVGVAQGERGDDLDAPVVVASVPTLTRRRDEVLRALAPSVVISDECHHAAAGTGWARLLDRIDQVGRFADGLPRHLGVTATWARGAAGAPRSLTSVWADGVVHSISMPDLMRHGHLVRPEGVSVGVDLDLASVRQSGGDWTDADLARAVVEADGPSAAAEAYRRLAWCETRDRLRPGIAVSPTVDVARQLTGELQAAGVPAATITGDTPRDERAAAYQAVRDQRLVVLSSVGVLTEGFDLPEVEVLLNLRPTRSWVLWVQTVGRVLRPAPWAGKTGALVVDLAGAAAGPLDRAPLGVEDVVDSPRGAVATKRAEPADERPACLVRLMGRTQHVQMLADSPLAWTTTRAGAHVVVGRDVAWALWPASTPGRWRVARGPLSRSGEATFLHGGADFDMPTAMAHAERDAVETDPSITQERSLWRRKRVSEKQAAALVRMGVPEAEAVGLRAGEASEAIAWAMASRRLDARWAAARAAWHTL